MGGYGQDIYKFCSSYLKISEETFTKIWNDKIYPNNKIRDMYNGIWMRIELSISLAIDLKSSLIATKRIAASYAARANAIFLLLSCLDALSGGRHIDFYQWLMKYKKQNNYTKKELDNYYESYLNDYGTRRKFVKVFEGFIELRFVNRYSFVYTKRGLDFVSLSNIERHKLINKANKKYRKMSDIEKAHIIGKYFYEMYRNVFVHQGIIPVYDIPDWVLEATNETDKRSFLSYVVPFDKQSGLITGTIDGDVIPHLILLVRLTLAKEIQKLA